MHLKAREKLKARRRRVGLEGRVRDENRSSNHGKDNHDKEENKEQMQSLQFISGEDIWTKKTGTSETELEPGEVQIYQNSCCFVQLLSTRRQKACKKLTSAHQVPCRRITVLWLLLQAQTLSLTSDYLTRLNKQELPLPQHACRPRPNPDVQQKGCIPGCPSAFLTRYLAWPLPRSATLFLSSQSSAWSSRANERASSCHAACLHPQQGVLLW